MALTFIDSPFAPGALVPVKLIDGIDENGTTRFTLRSADDKTWTVSYLPDGGRKGVKVMDDAFRTEFSLTEAKQNAQTLWTNLLAK